MRLKEKIYESKLSNSKVDEILLKSVSNDVFRHIRRSIDNYMYQIDIPEGVDKKWKVNKKKLAFRTVLENLSKKEGGVK